MGNYCSAMPTANEIFLAAKDGGLEELLRAGVDIDYRGSTGSHARDENGKTGIRTALHCAAAYGELAATKLLVANKANVDLKNQAGQTALDVAEFFRHSEVADYLRNLHNPTAEEAAAKAAQVFALDADIERISKLQQAKKWFQEHGVIEFFDDAVKQLGLTGPGDIEFLVRADLEAIGMPALKVRRVLAHRG